MANSIISRRSADATIRALAASPRLPAARQRRLSQLMKQSRESSLSARENAELESMLDEIDRKSFWMLARVLVKKRAAAKRQSAPR
jgi:hypothetical protein